MSNEQVNNPSETGFTANFSPLDDNVTQREYTKPNVKIDSFTPIEEPTFAIPSFEELDNNFRQQLGEDDPSGSVDDRKVWGRSEEMGSANPYVENLDKKEQKQASMAMVEAILDGYSQLKKLSNRLLMISPTKVQKLINEGEIDANTMIPMGRGQMIPLMDYIQTYNTEVSDTISMSDEFREKVSPVLLRVLQKRNIGMSDENLLAYYAVTDMLDTGIKIYGVNQQNKQILEQLKELKQSGVYSQQAPQSEPPKQKEAPKREERVFEEEEYEQPSKPQREYVEPEEIKVNKRDDYTQVEVLDDLQPEIKPKRAKKSRVVKSTAMPEFGDSDLIAHMESIAQNGNPRRRKK